MICRFSKEMKWEDVERIYELFNELEKALREVWPYGVLEGAVHKISMARKETGDALLWVDIPDCPLSKEFLDAKRREWLDTAIARAKDALEENAEAKEATK